jgi:fatty acyl-CoA reductase
MPDRFWRRMRELLPPQLITNLQTCQRVSVLDGDITKENFGLNDQTIAGLRERVSIFIHAASSINLCDGLPKMASSVVHPSLAAARLAFSFEHLERFVFVSTAYVNGFLHWYGDSANGGKREECIVEERIYPLRESNHGADVELHNIVDFGTTPEHSNMPHPFAYSYVKHLTERLLLEAFRAQDREQQLLLFRPSCFGPALQEPFPHFEVAGSSPVTTGMCAIISSLPTKARCTSDLANPSKSTIDEVPVDVVVNRLVAHIAFGTSGCVHAVAGASGRRSSPDMYNAIARLRRAWWWHPEIRWCPESTDPGKICALSKLYKMVGCSYLFREENTERVWQLMSPAMRETWPLWATRDPSDMSDFAVRGQTSGKMLTAWLGKKYGRPGRWMARATGPKS